MKRKALLLNKSKEDDIFNKIVSSRREKEKAITPNATQKHFNRIRQNILIPIKKQNEIENNIEKNLNIFKKIKLYKNNNILDNILKEDNYTIKKNKTIKYLPLKRNLSYTAKNIKRKKNNERDILSCLNIFSKKKKKDFSSVTSNINYLLERNQTLLMRDDKFNINNFNYIIPHYHHNLYKNLFHQNNFSSRNGMYGKKEDIPLFYEHSLTFRNDYLSKSEKNRHEILLNEINKLKFYLEQNPTDELLIIKDFLQKFHIKHISKFSDEKLLNLCKFIRKIKQSQIQKFIQPDSNIKKMIYNFINIPFELDEKNINNFRPFYSPQNHYRKINFNKNKTCYNFRVNKRKKYFDLYDTNSKLKYLENQKDLYKPNKNYSKNFGLLVDEISKEVKEVEKNIKKTYDIDNIQKKDDFLFITQDKRINKKNLILSPINSKKEENKDKGFYLVYSKNFVQLKNKNKNNNYLNNKMLNICLRKKEKKFEDKNKKKINDKGETIEEEKARIPTKEIAKRLYYIPTQKKFGLNDIRKNLKLTEYIALNFAKQKLNLNKLEYILHPYRDKKI